ncbi:MAG: hypothetical protein GX430_12975 [Treponema sp.]|nr:hypothetical protein [Treponema sp.]
MKCETFEELYDRAEEGAPLSPALALHLARCPRCAARVELRRRALELYRIPGPEPDLASRVLAVLPFLPRPHRTVSLRNWVLSGLALSASVVLVPAQRVFSLVIEEYGNRWMLPFVLVFGLSLSVFGALFIGTHMDELSGLVGRPRAKPAR